MRRASPVPGGFIAYKVPPAVFHPPGGASEKTDAVVQIIRTSPRGRHETSPGPAISARQSRPEAPICRGLLCAIPPRPCVGLKSCSRFAEDDAGFQTGADRILSAHGSARDARKPLASCLRPKMIHAVADHECFRLVQKSLNLVLTDGGGLLGCAPAFWKRSSRKFPTRPGRKTPVRGGGFRFFSSAERPKAGTCSLHSPQ
jgi:hypothetical protein